MRLLRLIACIAGLMTVLTANLASAQQPSMPKAGAEQQRLHYFVGHWKNQGEMKPSPFGPAGKFTSTDDAHMLGDFWLVTHSKGTGPMGAMEEISSIGYDSKSKAYTYSEYSSMGMHDTATGHVSGKTWTWTNEQEMGGKKVKGKFTIDEVSPTSYTYKFDFSNDNGKTWSNVMEGKATKEEKASKMK